MSPKAQRPLRGGAKTLSSPSSRPSGEASVPPPPAGTIIAAFFEEVEVWGAGGGVSGSCWNAGMGDLSQIRDVWGGGRLGLQFLEETSFPSCRNASVAVHGLCVVVRGLLFKCCQGA